MTVNFATANGSATGGLTCGIGVDFLSRNGTLTFTPHVGTQTISVPVCGDLQTEPRCFRIHHVLGDQVVQNLAVESERFANFRRELGLHPLKVISISNLELGLMNMEIRALVFSLPHPSFKSVQMVRWWFKRVASFWGTTAIPAVARWRPKWDMI